MDYKINRYEEKSDALFICINSLNNPVYIEHFFTEEELSTDESKKEAIEKLIAQLELMDEVYVAPEPFISKLEEVKSIQISSANIASAKQSIVLEKARIETERLSELETIEVPNEEPSSIF